MFNQNLSRTIRICINQDSLTCSKQAAFNPLAQITNLLLREFTVKERGLGGIRFFQTMNLDAQLLAFRSQFSPQFTVRDLDEILVILGAMIDLLLDVGKVTNHNRTDFVFKAVIGQALHSSIKKVVDSKF